MMVDAPSPRIEYGACFGPFSAVTFAKPNSP